jgi:hypothetical protein
MKAAMARVSALSVLSAMPLAAARAQEPEKHWYTQADIQTLHSNYSDSLVRDALDNLGFFIRSDYLERGGFTLGYNRTALKFTDDTADVEQDGWFASARAQVTPDWAKGQITFRLDGYVISNDGSTSEVTDADVIAPQVSFLNYDRSFYMDLGYAKSSYGDSPLSAETLEVEQWTPTLGFGFNEQRSWVQLRAYLIEPSNASRAQDVEDTAALQLSYRHWTRARRFLGVDNFRFSALIGERVYAVDPDAAAVYNLTDLQSGGASIGSEWVPSERTRVLLLLGVERYEDRSLGDEYDSPFAYLNFTYRWY